MLPSARGQIQQREAPLSWRFLSPTGTPNSETVIRLPCRHVTVCNAGSRIGRHPPRIGA